MSKEEINEKSNNISRIISEILDFNEEIKKQQGSGLKIVTPDQMLSRLPNFFSSIKSTKIF